MHALTRHLSSFLFLALPAAGSIAQTPITPVAHVDLQRYAGDWYVIASIPTRQEHNAVNGMDSFVLLADGRIKTTLRYRVGAPHGEAKTLHATGYVRPGTGNAVWSMEFVWPLKAEYIIAWLDSEYRTVIVARSKRDYVWILARTPTIPDDQYQQLASRVASLGYDANKLRKMPQQWESVGSD